MVAVALQNAVRYMFDRTAALYGDHWAVELRIREVKTTLRMDVLRSESPDVIRKETLVHFLAYGLIGALMWQVAQEHDRPPQRLSFGGTVERWHALTPYMCLFRYRPQAVTLYRLLSWIAAGLLADRPHRVESRTVKRRPRGYNLLNRP